MILVYCLGTSCAEIALRVNDGLGFGLRALATARHRERHFNSTFEGDALGCRFWTGLMRAFHFLIRDDYKVGQVGSVCASSAYGIDYEINRVPGVYRGVDYHIGLNGSCEDNWSN